MENFFKQSFENFEEEVSPKVWDNVKLGIAAGAGVGFFAKSWIQKIGLNILVAVVSSASTIAVMNWKNDKKAAEATAWEITPTPVSNTTITTTDSVKEEVLAEKTELSVKKTEESPVVEEKKEKDEAFVGIKKDKKKIAEVINTFANDEEIASISASCVGGAVPLIVNLSNNGSGKINKWTYSDDGKSVTTANPIKVFDTPGTYIITLSSKSSDGRTDIDSVKIEVTGNSSLVPSSASFSPNGDKVDDEFIFKSVNIAKMSALIVDDKGNIVYDYKGTECRWNGNDLKGNKAKEGTYYYIMSAEGFDGKKYAQKGKITLTR